MTAHLYSERGRAEGEKRVIVRLWFTSVYKLIVSIRRISASLDGAALITDQSQAAAAAGETNQPHVRTNTLLRSSTNVYPVKYQYNTYYAIHINTLIHINKRAV